MTIASIGSWVKLSSDFDLLESELKGFSNEYSINKATVKLYYNSEKLLRIGHLDFVNNRKTHYFQFYEEFKDYNNYAFHGLVPYKGKFYSRIPRAIINNFNLESGDWIIDPFCGSGTTNLEAQLMGVNSVGLDISYYSYFISKLKLELINLNYRDISLSRGELKFIFVSINEGNFKIDNNPINSLLLFIFLDVKDMQSRLKVKKDLFYLFKRKLEKILNSIRITKDILDLNNIVPGQALILNENALDSKKIFKKKFDAIITSPPYFFSLNYLNRNRFFNQFFKINEYSEKENQLGRYSFRSFNNYKESFQFELGKALEVFNSITKDNGKIAIVMGNSKFKGRIIDNCNFIQEKGRDLNWNIISIITNPIIGKNTQNIYQEKIFLFEK